MIVEANIIRLETGETIEADLDLQVDGKDQGMYLYYCDVLGAWVVDDDGETKRTTLSADEESRLFDKALEAVAVRGLGHA